MSKINIPERLAARLSHEDKGHTWLAPVLQFKANIESILAKDPDFFPDYTLHGVPHLNRVLELASQLISTDTLSADPHPDKKDLLTPRDVAFLVCGILLHDMGMYLRPDGLKKLIKQTENNDAFGGKLWNQEWSDYVDRTKRLSQEKMRYHFGRVILVTEDCVDHADTDDNKRIIGEFLRQHHARLAHEFAIGLLPGSTDTDLFANTGLMKKDRMMIGLLARSHGMAIRDTEEFLKTKFDNTVKPYNLPVFYLMAVLRIADYLDADGQRAPKQLTQQQKISVPLSAEEWTWNQCINADATYFHLEHKNYHVEAEPETSPQYVQLEKWLKSVQTDLDLCWSILAEKYPDDKNRYRLSIHRVVSNIHQPDHVKELNNTFLTKEAKISANPEIIKLMMEPLYGDDPTYGVRELLQNAVDACLEREQWEKTHKEGDPNYKGLVDIRIENGIFTITDNGMGMNEDVLLNYYLSAGSSYRSSDAWMAANTKDGKSQVARTGRFGVGFLASFLLGDIVEVQTQHRIPHKTNSQSSATDQQGYTFSFGQKSNLLDVRRIKRVNIHSPQANDSAGTTIRIHLRNGVAERLSSNSRWCNWFVFDTPEVHFTIDGGEIQKTPIISRTPHKNTNWFSLSSKKYSVFQWKPSYHQDTRRFYCNGILVEHALEEHLRHHGLNVFPPVVSIIDDDANLSLNLARDKLLAFPEKETLYQELFRYYIAKLLMVQWESYDDFCRNIRLGFVFHHDDYGKAPFLFSCYGYTVNYASVLRATDITEYNLCSVAWLPTAYKTCHSMNEEDIPIEFVSEVNNAIFTFVSDILKTGSFHHGKDVIGYSTQYAWDILALSKSVYDDYPKPWTKHLAQYSSILKSHFIYYRKSTKILWEPIISNLENQHAEFAIHIVPAKDGKFFPDNSRLDSLFIRTMKEMLIPYPDQPDHPAKNLWIPLDMAERRRKFPKAFEYIDQMNLADALSDNRVSPTEFEE